MKKMKRLFWLLPLLMGMLVTGCLKEDLNENTIILMGSESDVVPIEEMGIDTLLAYVSDTSVMHTLVMDLPTGSIPPDIQGGYLFGPRFLDKYNGGTPPGANDTVLFRFGGAQDSLIVLVDHTFHAGDALIQGNDTTWFAADTTIQLTETTYYYPNGQHNRMVPCAIYGDVVERDGYQTKSAAAFVVGSGSAFTAYFTVEYDCDETQTGLEYTLKRGYVLTGSITPEGIERARLACVNIDATMLNASSSVPEDAIRTMVNRIYVYRVRKQGDPIAFGTAYRCQW